MSLTAIHSAAAQAANAAVPNYTTNGTPQHAAWLRAYDVAFMRLHLEHAK